MVDEDIVKDGAAQIERIINTHPDIPEQIGRKLANIHPTLQQNFMRMVLAFIQEMASKKYWDLRNEASVEIAKILWEELKKTKYYSKVPQEKIYLRFV
jgi:hypothetical protein